MFKKLFNLYPGLYRSGEEMLVGDKVYIPALRKMGQVVFISSTNERMLEIDSTKLENVENGFVVAVAEQMYHFSETKSVVFKMRTAGIGCLPSNDDGPASLENYPTFGGALTSFFKRLTLGLVIAAALLIFIILNAIPYGGGPKEPIYAFVFIVSTVPFWAMWPMFRYMMGKLSKTSSRLL